MCTLQQLTRLIGTNQQYQLTTYSYSFNTLITRMIQSHKLIDQKKHQQFLHSDGRSLITNYQKFFKQHYTIQINEKKILITCNPWHRSLNKISTNLLTILLSPQDFIQAICRQISPNETKGLLQLMHAIAFRHHASDLHLTSHQNDGTLLIKRKKNILSISLSKSQQFKLSNLIKLTANLDPSIQRKSQDGAYQFNYMNRSVDIRVATLPTFYGELISLRILTTGNKLRTFQSLGFESKQIHYIHN